MAGNRVNKLRDIRGFTIEEIGQALQGMNEQPFRGHQIFQWLHMLHAESWAEMTTLSKSLRQKLADTIPLDSIEVLKVQKSQQDRTAKYLFGLPDGQAVESVLMWYRYGASICISSQVGCRMGCGFCASTLEGLVRNLTAGEMAHQVSAVHRLGIPAGERAHSLVIMGSGEPLDNYDEVLRFLRNLNHPDGLGMSYRRMTLSTCGLIPQMDMLAEEGIPINLSVSLHSVVDETRNRIMPVNKMYPVDELLEASDRYARKTGRRITFEYALIEGVNDGEKDAIVLADRVGSIHCHINLIPLNPVTERSFNRSRNEKVQQFLRILSQKGIQATIRRELGADIDAACGQLRNRHVNADTIVKKAGIKDD